MAGTFILGETKVRPGAYFNIQKKEESGEGILEGVTAVLFRADFGPLNTVVELKAGEPWEKIFGNGLTTDAIGEALEGGARTVLACRIGNGGTPATVALHDTEGTEAVVISVNYPGDKDFSVSVREKLSDSTRKECLIYSGTREFEKLEFAAGEGEAERLVSALNAMEHFHGELTEGKEKALLAAVSQEPFAGGSNPQVTAEDYSNGFAQTEAWEFNTICVDTEDQEIHLLLAAFVNRMFEEGLPAQAVVAENHTVPLETRQNHAAAFNNEKMNYVLNAHMMELGKDGQEREIDGYRTAARIAGMIGATPSGQSLTHTVVEGFTEILEKLTNSQMIHAESKKGCIVFSHNREKKVWIDNAINTLITPADNQDDGWKKIRRVATRFELLRRLNAAVEELVGKTDNDSNGRSTIVSRMNDIGTAMVEESKLTAFKASESSTYPADVDSAWFDISVTDKDSMERIYLTYQFQFSTNE